MDVGQTQQGPWHPVVGLTPGPSSSPDRPRPRQLRSCDSVAVQAVGAPLFGGRPGGSRWEPAKQVKQTQQGQGHPDRRGRDACWLAGGRSHRQRRRVANPVVVGSVLVVVGPVVVVVVGPVLVVVGLVVVGRAVVVGSVVLVEAAVVVETTVVIGAVVVLGVITGGWPVAPGMAIVLVTVVLFQGDAVGVACRPPVVIGRLAADGLVSGPPVGGEDAVVGSVVVLVVLGVKDVGCWLGGDGRQGNPGYSVRRGVEEATRWPRPPGRAEPRR
jgi:hypothetical protein